jgi:hypothetical protein
LNYQQDFAGEFPGEKVNADKVLNFSGAAIQNLSPVQISPLHEAEFLVSRLAILLC